MLSLHSDNPLLLQVLVGRKAMTFLSTTVGDTTTRYGYNGWREREKMARTGPWKMAMFTCFIVLF